MVETIIKQAKKRHCLSAAEPWSESPATQLPQRIVTLLVSDSDLARVVTPARASLSTALRLSENGH